MEKERERNINVWMPLTWPALGTWPAIQACALDWELNRQSFGLQAHAQSTELCQPGPNKLFNVSPTLEEPPDFALSHHELYVVWGRGGVVAAEWVEGSVCAWSGGHLCLGNLRPHFL